jgi:hypothetical protein
MNTKIKDNMSIIASRDNQSFLYEFTKNCFNFTTCYFYIKFHGLVLYLFLNEKPYTIFIYLCIIIYL